MSGYVSVELRRAVFARADHRCEYCLIREDDTWLGCEVDHILSQKHGGPTDFENLAVACAVCNRAKGTDLGSIDPETGELTRFFHPRTDQFREHFRLIGARIIPLTAIGRVTETIFEFNSPERLAEREILQELQRYPVRF